ncbi:sugar ABC transporter substrate-binding protein, partial [Pseudomonas syringae pv. tagetis]
ETRYTKHYYAMIFVPFDTMAVVCTVARAMENDNPVIASNTRVAGNKVPYLGNDHLEAGRQHAQPNVDKHKGKSNHQ